jgi:hypothetical protein
MKLKAKSVSHSFWLNLTTKACAKFKIDLILINSIPNFMMERLLHLFPMTVYWIIIMLMCPVL